MAGTLETDHLTELIQQKLAALSQLRELVRDQLALIGDGEMTKLLALLSSKQKLLAHVQETERLLDPFRKQDPETRQWRTQADRQNTAQMADRCAALMAEIMLLEKQSESDLSSRRDRAEEQLHSTAHASQARKAYQPDTHVRPTRFDVSR